jgi:hypothetical protein
MTIDEARAALRDHLDGWTPVHAARTHAAVPNVWVPRIFDFGAPGATQYISNCHRCGHVVALSTAAVNPNDCNTAYDLDIYVRCVCGASVMLSIPVLT